MVGRSNSEFTSRNGRFDLGKMGQDINRLTGNLCFGISVVILVVFIFIVTRYQPNAPPTKITSFLASTSDATFKSDGSVIKTGEDFITNVNRSIATLSFINITDIAEEQHYPTPIECDVDKPMTCNTPEIFHLLMRATIEAFNDTHFYRFGKPITSGVDDTSCDIAWKYRPKDAKRDSLYKDYRRFVIKHNTDCSYTVVSIGEYHSGVNARKKKKKAIANNNDGRFESNWNPNSDVTGQMNMPVVGDVVNDSLPIMDSEVNFSSGKYLVYTDGGERCKSMDHYIWSFLCALGEAQHLNRTLVVDLSICLSSMYSLSNQDEEGKDFRFYFDFEHLKESTPIIDQAQFWNDWEMWYKRNNLNLYFVEDFRVTPMKLESVPDTLIMRKFGTVEPDNYWYRVCEGETESVIQRPWHLLWKSKRLIEIVSGIASKMNWDFDAVHIIRGEKAKNTRLWPNLETDTSPTALLNILSDKIDGGRNLFISTDEEDTSFFDPLKDKYTVHFIDDFKDLWEVKSDWYVETRELNNGIPVEFDGYMKAEVKTEVFLRAKKQLETFNDLTKDCKDGINTCTSSP
ncbi:hypothetical protein ZOSMA_381G00180 [Zostera marina]|uniref:O-fucosyltransferase family protein n=1 Tax=Zostera marina TaxID=29655 RepID=A0A0K9P519_ZOSMR|nr:hypothetical protein ZOSMA_381G00180 [Zostera marina]